MKKLMIAAAIVCAAAFAQAANVSWGSGLMYAPSSTTTGGWDWNKSVQSAGIVFTETVFLLAGGEEEFDKIKGYSQADLYKYYKDNYATTTPTVQASNKNAQGTILNIANPTITGTANQWYYSLVIAETTVKDTQGNDVDMYMASALAGQAGQTGAKAFNNVFGGTSSSHGVANWQTVPEPTSGLLLLLGVAGLALRRRRA